MFIAFPAAMYLRAGQTLHTDRPTHATPLEAFEAYRSAPGDGGAPGVFEVTDAGDADHKALSVVRRIGGAIFNPDRPLIPDLEPNPLIFHLCLKTPNR